MRGKGFLGGRLASDLEVLKSDTPSSPEGDQQQPSLLRRRTPSSSNFYSGKLGTDLEEIAQRKVKRARQGEGGHVDEAKHIYLWEPKSLRIRTINWWHVFLAEYLNWIYNLAILAAVGAIIWQINTGSLHISKVVQMTSDPLVLQMSMVFAVILAYMSRWKPPVYCIDNVVYVPPQDWQVSRDDLIKMMKAQDCFSESSMSFLQKILDNSGTGESTHWPPGILKSKDGETKADRGTVAAREEGKVVIFSMVKDILAKTGVHPKQIDFLIINCSIYCPTPSLCALVSNEFHFREDVRSYNLGGMGCSANVIAVDLAKQLLQSQPGSRALVISTENITQNLYHGNEKSMLLQNTLFRCGGCALMLSSRRIDSMIAKYKLLYTFRTQASDDSSYNCVYQKEDGEGHVGVALSKDIVSIAGRAMRKNFVALGPHVLPIREQALVGLNMVQIHLVKMAKKMKLPGTANWNVPTGYTPNFCRGIDHFCIHAGGRAVIEGVQKNLSLSDRHVAPSFQTLHDFGNTSSSSVWYEFEWVERFGGIRVGERVLQIAFGSGFKCNSAVWVCLRVDETKRGVPLKLERQRSVMADSKQHAEAVGH
eukprot:TRINITY_DN25526_c0_g1_i1.p1 TRINITY_DN25526_c0_g1~~TRINITY_DN25526_c0_g1_i1.p1  ORF type:complete len:593 (-),score=178.55 TRINITY_DN25526_c0_g1_i1:252-2030(-)